MVDFSKKIKNSNKFREPAIRYEMTGSYCSYPSGTSEYYKFWEEEKDRCINGYTAEDGDFITGYNYFYLNYCRIKRVYRKEVTRNGVTKLRTFREEGFADFYDYDYYYFQAIDEAEFLGKHLPVLKARGKGYSFKGASMLCRNFFLLPGSISYAFAGTKEYLLKDGILSKTKDIIDFINENTAWTKKMDVKNTEMHRRASFQVTDEAGNKIEVGYKSEIIGVVLDDPNKARGKRCKLALIEEAGSCNDLLTAIQILRPSVEEDGEAYGIIIPFGTGGEEGVNFEGLKELFFHGNGYNFLQFDNIWSEGAQGSECGFFVPEWANMSKTDENGNRLYMDKDGNSLMHKALQLISSEREKVVQGATNSQAVDRYIAEHPITPEEACLTLTGNIFPKKELQLQLAKIRTNKKLQNLKQVGNLYLENGEAKWTPKKSGDITSYHIKKREKSDLDRYIGDDFSGSIVIWEHPPKDPPLGMYIACCLTPGEKVMTDKGLLNVEDVTLDNKLISQEGDLVKINTLLRHEKDKEDIYTVKVSNTFRTTTFTHEHPIYVSEHKLNKDNTISESNFHFDYIRMRNVKVGSWTRIPNIYTKVKDYKNPICDDIHFWWFLGLWLGDGWCDDRGNIFVSFNKNEIDYINKFKWFVTNILHKKIRKPSVRGNCETISFRYKKLSEYLINNFGKYAHSKTLPEFVKYLDKWSKLQLVRGYLNSDGCITKNRKYYSMEFVSVNLLLLEGIQDILFSLGIVSNLTKLRNASTHIFDQKRVCKTKECFHLRIGHNHTIDLSYLLYPTTLDDDHKLEKIDFDNLSKTRRKPKNGCFISDDLKYIYFQIKDIVKKSYTGTVYNFNCDTHTFICHHITTHNCDPYDHDHSGTNSLGSTFIYKRSQAGEEYSDVIVAEYTGRPATAEEYYENVRKLLLYYNARMMCENQNVGIISYFTNKHCDYLLADQPGILQSIVTTTTSKVHRKKGSHVSKEIKLWGLGKLKEWLLEEFAPGHRNLERIYSEPLLEELISYNDQGNFDRVMALVQLMIYKEDLYDTKVKQIKKEEKDIRLFELPIFSEAWFNNSDEVEPDPIFNSSTIPFQVNNDNTIIYTF